MISPSPAVVDPDFRARDLVWLAVGHTAYHILWTAVVRHILNFGWEFHGLPRWLVVNHDQLLAGQAATCGLAAGLILKRRFSGLLWTVVLGLMWGLLDLLLNPLVVLYQWQWYASGNDKFYGEYIPSENLLNWPFWFLAACFVGQGLRFFFGCQIARPHHASQLRVGQFHIADLMEWTATIAVWFGIHYWIGPEIGGLFDQSLDQLGPILISVATAMALSSNRRPSLLTFVYLFAWVQFVNFTVNCIFWAAGSPFSWHYFTISSLGTVGSLLPATVTFGLLRRWGYRWVSRSRVH
jgi:hypothetical protein